MIIIICDNEMPAEKMSAYIEEVRASGAVEATRSEAGNISYDFSVSMDVPGKTQIIERWADAAALKKHTKSKNLVKLMSIGKKYGVINNIKIYNASAM